MSRVTSFPSALGPAPRALVLGSMPGQASLRAQQYYAHPRNAFWPLMHTLFGVDAGLPYATRLAALNHAGVGLWDVLAACERRGSLDSAIAAAGREVNAIDEVLRRAPTLRVVALNGGAAATLFRRQVLPALGARRASLHVLSLPSTSPAHAARSFAQKLEAWRALPAAMADADARPCA